MADNPSAVPEAQPARRKWRGIEPDARTAERKQRLIEAAIALLSSAGLSGTTVRAVCAGAGLHNRYFYESFDDIDSLLVAVFDQLSTGFLDHITAAADSAGEDPRARLQAVMEATAEVVRQQRALVRILTVQATGNEELNRRRVRMLHHVAELIEEDTYRTYGAPAEGDRIAAVSARFMAGGLAELFLSWVDGEMEGDIEDLSRDAVDVIWAFSESSRAVAEARAAKRRGRRRSARG